MKLAWKPFNGPALVDQLGNGAAVTVRAAGRPETPVTLNQFGQPIAVATGRLIEWSVEEVGIPEAEKPAPAAKA